MYKYIWYCRWCGKPYSSITRTDRDGFCGKAHKQAHYRAYKKYVTLPAARPGSLAAPAVTPKKRKKRKR